jgi:polyferredoxin
MKLCQRNLSLPGYFDHFIGFVYISLPGLNDNDMLKITPHLGIMVLIVSIGGIFYPKLGYFLLLVFASLMIIAPFRGRWFCGNLCPRGSFVDFWLP